MFKLLKQKTNKNFLVVVLSLLVCILLFFIVYTTSASSFTLDNVVLSKKLDNETSSDILDSETSPSDRIILSFDYLNANIGQTLRVVWLYNDKVVADDILKLSRTDGNRSLALLSSTGSYLPKGAYCVKIFLGDDLLKQISFIVS